MNKTEQQAERMNVICNIQAMQQKIDGQQLPYSHFKGKKTEALRNLQNTLIKKYNESLKKP